MSLRTLLSAIGRHPMTFLGVTVPLLGLGAAGLYFMPMQYVSTTELLVSIQGSTTAAAYQNDGVVSTRINSYIPLLTSDVVSQRVIDKLGLPLSAPELSAKISAVNVPPSTALIDIAVTDQSPDRARQLADTVASEFISYAGALETPTGEDGQKVSTTVVTAASEPKARIGELIVLAVAAALVALALGALAVWIRARRHPVRPSEQRAVTADTQSVEDGPPIEAAPSPAAEREPYREPAPALADHLQLADQPVAWADSPTMVLPVMAEREPVPVSADLPEYADQPVAEIDSTFDDPARSAERERYDEVAPVIAVVRVPEPEGPHDNLPAVELLVAEADGAVDEHRRPRTRLRSKPTSAGSRELRLMSDDGDEPRGQLAVPPALDQSDQRLVSPVVVDPEMPREQAVGTARVNGSRHRAHDADDANGVADDREKPAPAIRVNGSRHRAVDPDAEHEASTAAEVAYEAEVEPIPYVRQANGIAHPEYAGSPEYAENVVKDWDGQRWIRRR